MLNEPTDGLVVKAISAVTTSPAEKPVASKCTPIFNA